MVKNSLIKWSSLHLMREARFPKFAEGSKYETTNVISHCAYPESRHPALMLGRDSAYHACILNRKVNVAWKLIRQPDWFLHKVNV